MEPRKIPEEELCTFANDLFAFRIRCGYANRLLCSKQFSQTCHVFQWFMNQEQRMFEERHIVWNRSADGTRGIYHGEQL